MLKLKPLVKAVQNAESPAVVLLLLCIPPTILASITLSQLADTEGNAVIVFSGVLVGLLCTISIATLVCAFRPPDMNANFYELFDSIEKMSKEQRKELGKRLKELK